jgi:hypothetical protein
MVRDTTYGFAAVLLTFSATSRLTAWSNLEDLAPRLAIIGNLFSVVPAFNRFSRRRF